MRKFQFFILTIIYYVINIFFYYLEIVCLFLIGTEKRRINNNMPILK